MPPAQDVNPLNFASSGWGVIFAPSIGPDIEEALSPLLKLRMKQAGAHFRLYRYQSGQTKDDFLRAQKSGLGPADPKRGKVPYYLLIVGSPEEISFRFQCELDVQYAVGRIYFERAEDYVAYARTVVQAESGEGPLPRRQVALFGTAHQDDIATERGLQELIKPLAGTLAIDRAGWEIKTYLKSQATKEQLGKLLGGSETPSVLFAASHGLRFPFDDPLQRSRQGAILCQDWPGEDHAVLPLYYFSAEDLAEDAQISGLIPFFFCDFSAGTKISLASEGSLGKPQPIASAPFVSRLAQRLLSHPNGGALGFVGLNDRAWVTSFSWSEPSQIQLFENTLKRLLDGHPLGSAMEFFNQRYAELAVEYEALLRDRENLVDVDDALFARMFRSSNEMASYIVIGDPAVCLRWRDKAATLTIGELPGAVNDRVAEKDELGAESYILALADLIESRDTQPPLTIGIFGSWGMGKSFLLKHLSRVLTERAENRKENQPEEEATRVPKIHTVNFNAWEYGASEVIWPALARKIIDQLERGIPWRLGERFSLRLRRSLKRQLDRNRGWLLFLGFALLVVTAVLLLVPGVKASKVAGTLLTLSGIGVLFKLIKDALHNSIGQWIANAFQGRDYGRPIDLIELIRSDLDLVEARIKQRGERALILIDDLDRCEPGKSVEMLQALNLLLDFESFIVCLGVDARIVTRAVERHYQGLLGEAGASGYEYLDKIIQVPFRIPAPTPENVRFFLASLMKPPQAPLPVPVPQGSLVAGVEAPASATGRGHVTPPEVIPKMAPAPKDAAESQPIVKPNTSAISFSREEYMTFRSLSPWLRPNPRHIKRLVNVYRLVRSLARYPPSEPLILQNPEATICWIVICSQWPYTAHLMMREQERLLKIATATEGERGKFPPGRPLVHLLNAVKEKGDSQRRLLLDGELGLLEDLVHSEFANIGWEELRIIRRYTINFNPAIEFEWVLDSDEPAVVAASE